MSRSTAGGSVDTKQIEWIFQRFETLIEKYLFDIKRPLVVFARRDVADLREHVILTIECRVNQPHRRPEPLTVGAFDPPLELLWLAVDGRLNPRLNVSLRESVTGRAVVGDRTPAQLGFGVAIQFLNPAVGPDDPPGFGIMQHNSNTQVVENGLDSLLHQFHDRRQRRCKNSRAGDR